MKIFVLMLILISIFLFTGCKADNDALEEISFDSTCGNDYQMVSSNSESIPSEFVTISAEEANSMIEENTNVLIVDVRRQDEYDEKHIPGAVLLPNETIDEASVSEAGLTLDDTILIYCRSGNRSKEAAQKLVDIGYTKVYDFGGINDWPYEVE